MPAHQVCQKFFKKSLSFLHQYRRDALCRIAMTLTRGASLTLTSMGRHLQGGAQVKHKIKRVDRFLANPRLQAEIPMIYHALTAWLTQHLPCCVIAVDWTGCCGRDFHLLRASLLYQGRALPFMSHIVAASELNKSWVHRDFLNKLRAAIGPDKKVIIVTDAGFRTPWFNDVHSLGWDFVGRIRGLIQFNIGTTDWRQLIQISHSASSTPRYLGEGRLAKAKRSGCHGHFYLYKAIPKHRKRHKQKNKIYPPKIEKEYSTSGTEPWLLISSMEEKKANKIIDIYAKRTQIEQNFRDEKNQRFGFGWRDSMSKGIQRLSVLSLVACIAAIFLWMIGFMAENEGEQKKFQANSCKSRRVLSYLTLAQNILRHKPPLITLHFLNKAYQLFVLSYPKNILEEGY